MSGRYCCQISLQTLRDPLIPCTRPFLYLVIYLSSCSSILVLSSVPSHSCSAFSIHRGSVGTVGRSHGHHWYQQNLRTNQGSQAKGHGLHQTWKRQIGFRPSTLHLANTVHILLLVGPSFIRFQPYIYLCSSFSKL